MAPPSPSPIAPGNCPVNLRLLSLVFAPFALGTSAFIYIGLIEPMSRDLGVGIASVGQLQTVFALACGIGGPVLARLLAGFDRKRLLLCVLAILAAMNLGSALAPSLIAIGGIRFAAGFFAALTLPLASTLAVSLVPEASRPKAIATVLAGYTLAFLIGMPAGSILGDIYGWRSAFWLAAAISAVAFIVIGLFAPAHIHAPEAGASSFRRALQGENPKLMFITLLSFAGTFATVSFIGPVITASTGLTGSGIAAIQLSTGIGSLLGLPAGALLARLTTRRALSILLGSVLVTQVLFSLGMLFDLGVLAIPVLVFTMAFNSAALFGTSPVVQSQLANAAGPATTIAFALNGSMLYSGQGLGSSLGGAVTNFIGLGWTGIAGAVAALLALLLARRLHV
ncbi:Arabinose efflux permease [Congregibacter litoralis KT71]|uniref:Arabinose efflux permease n=1 Tax=Congregibacter litoralis KT71 TaxID=314285 RepID=A4AD90_9GAMM|nr:Arabinose efflux permease [Congregibacter litoralis KT71]